MASAAVFLSGCWTPPSANVRPHGGPGVIAGGMQVEGVVDSAMVESVDRGARTLVLSLHGATLPACTVGQGVRNWEGVNAGDEVRATIREVLAVYVAPAHEGRSRSPGVRSLSLHAHVLAVDPSYRLLTVQFPSGGTETFKLGLHTAMTRMAPGDAVAIRPIEATELHVLRRANRHESSRSGRSATPAG